jgi:hypothetical protein
MVFVVEVIGGKTSGKLVNLHVVVVDNSEQMSSMGEFDFTATPDWNAIVFLQLFLEDVEHADAV